MVVIGGLGSIPGAVLGALYLEGLPALFGANATIQFLTSGLGLIAFILYLPGGLGELLHRFGDVVTVGLRCAAGPSSDRAIRARRSRTGASGIRGGQRVPPVRPSHWCPESSTRERPRLTAARPGSPSRTSA